MADVNKNNIANKTNNKIREEIVYVWVAMLKIFMENVWRKVVIKINILIIRINVYVRLGTREINMGYVRIVLGNVICLINMRLGILVCVCMGMKGLENIVRRRQMEEFVQLVQFGTRIN